MRSAIALLALLTPLAATADELAKSPFSGEVDAAYLKSTGSSNKETIKGRVDTQYKVNAWTHQFKAEGLNESDNDTGEHTTERYLAMEKSSWNFTDRDYLFGKVQWEKDLQTEYDYQAFFAVGYGRQIIKTDTMFLSSDLGAGVRYNKIDATGESDSEALGNFALKYEWNFRKGGRFNEDLSVETGQSGTVLRTRTALTFDLTDVLGLNLAYETKSDSGPSEVADTLTTVGLNYRFK